MIEVLNGFVKRGDLVAYSVRKHWAMATRVGVVVDIVTIWDWNRDAWDVSLQVRVVKSSEDVDSPSRLVWLTELDRVVKVDGAGL